MFPSSPLRHDANLIIYFILIWRSLSCVGPFPRQSYSPKIVRAAGPWRVLVEKKIFWPFFCEDSSNNKQSPEAEWQCKRSNLHNVLNNWVDTAAFRWHGTHIHSQSLSTSSKQCFSLFPPTLKIFLLFLIFLKVRKGMTDFFPLHLLVNYFLTQPGAITHPNTSVWRL